MEKTPHTGSGFPAGVLEGHEGRRGGSKWLLSLEGSGRGQVQVAQGRTKIRLCGGGLGLYLPYPLNMGPWTSYVATLGIHPFI